MSAKQEAADRAKVALQDLVIETMREGGQGAFAQVSQLAMVGQTLERTLGNRVEDFLDGHGAMANLYQVDDRDYGQGDVQGTLRQMMLLVGPLLQGQAEVHRAHVASDEMDELQYINREIKDQGQAIDLELLRRRQQLLANVKLRNDLSSAADSSPALQEINGNVE